MPAPYTYRSFLYYTDFGSDSEKVKTVRLNRTGVIRTIKAATLLACMLVANPDQRNAHAATLLLPPRSVFFLPAALTGPPFAVYGSQTSSTSHFPSGDILTTYSWSVLPAGMNKPSTGTFSVVVMRSAALAATKSANLDSLASHGCVGNDAGCSTAGSPNTPLLGKPGGGWLRGVCSQPTYCAFGGGAAYRNVFFMVEVDCEGAHASRCTGWTDRLIRLLVGHLAWIIHEQFGLTRLTAFG